MVGLAVFNIHSHLTYFPLSSIAYLEPFCFRYPASRVSLPISRYRNAEKSSMAKKLTIQHAIEIARQKSGECVSTAYQNARAEMSWRCEFGHVWNAPYDRIKAGKWCPTCAGKSKTIEDCRRAAERKGGACLSRKYVNGNTKLKWQCGDGHVWYARPRHILSGPSWCPICVGRVQDEHSHALKLDKMRHLAIERGGELLTSKYTSAKTKMEWRCSAGHLFSATWNNVSKGTWCAQCNIHSGEELVRLTLEAIFSEHKFPKVRPDFLKWKRNRNLELDGYCEKLKLAFEFDGRQHFQETLYSSGMELSEIKGRDKFKDEILKNHGIALIRVRYDDDLSHLPDLIKSRVPPDRIDLLAYDYCVDLDRNILFRNTDKLRRFNAIAESKSGKCLSDNFVNFDTKLEFECKSGHRWFAYPDNILKGKWCKKCSHKSRVSNRTDSLDWEKVLEIRSLYEKGDYTYTALGKMFGVSRVTVSNIVNLRTRATF